MKKAKHVLRTLRIEREKIKRIMKRVEDQLSKIERGQLSVNAPYISHKIGHSISDLASPHKNLQAALKNDLLILRQQLKTVTSDQRSVRSQVVKHDIVITKKRLKNHISEMLKDGEVSSGELQEAQELADHVLEKSTGLLKINPSISNIKSVLSALTDSQLLGSDLDDGMSKSSEAISALKEAGEKRYLKAENDFRRTPSTKNLSKMFEEDHLIQMFGGFSESKRTGWVAAGGIQHRTNKDTLSGLSKKYYGSWGFWDIIYYENLEIIGYNPDRLPNGIIIDIP